MKSNNGLQIIIRITVCVTMLSSLIGAFMLHSTPSHRESGSVLILVSVAAAVLWVLEEVVFHNHTRKYVAKLSTMISKTERDSLLNFPAPAIIIDSENETSAPDAAGLRHPLLLLHVPAHCLHDRVQLQPKQGLRTVHRLYPQVVHQPAP